MGAHRSKPAMAVFSLILFFFAGSARAALLHMAGVGGVNPATIRLAEQAGSTPVISITSARGLGAASALSSAGAVDAANAGAISRMSGDRNDFSVGGVVLGRSRFRLDEPAHRGLSAPPDLSTMLNLHSRGGAGFFASFLAIQLNLDLPSTD